jgi:hypothetical protein
MNTPKRSLNFRCILSVLWLPALFWGAAVVAVTAFGYPGVVCITPLAWLLAVPVGQQVVERSELCRSNTPLYEAGVAGGLLGIFQGLLFLLVGFIGPMPSLTDRQVALVLCLLMTFAGLFVCSAVAVFFAHLRQQQMEREKGMLD